MFTKIPLGRRVVDRLISALPLQTATSDVLRQRVFNSGKPVSRARKIRGPRRTWRLAIPGLLLWFRSCAIRMVLRILRAVADSRIPKVAALLERGLDLLPVGEDLRIRLSEAIFQGSANEKTALAHSSIIQFSEYRQRLLNGKRVSQSEQETTLNLLCDHDTIHLFFENHARLPDWLLDPRLAHCRFVVHAFDERKDSLQHFGLEERARTVSLRDQFSDTSPESEKVHLFARHLARGVVETLYAQVPEIARIAPPKRIAELAQSLEDDVAWHTSLIECIRHAFRTVPDEAPIVFVASGTDCVPKALPFLLSELAPERFFVATGHRNPTKARRFWQALNDHLIAAEQDDPRPPQASKENAKKESGLDELGRDVAERLQARCVAARKAGDNYGNLLAAEIGMRASQVFAYTASTAIYSETIAALVRDIAAREALTPLLLSCTTVASNGDLAHRIGKLSPSPSMFDLSPFLPLLVRSLDADKARAIETLVRTTLPDRLKREGIDLGDFVMPRIIAFVDGKFQIALATYRLGRRIAGIPRLHSGLTCPGRHWLVRAFAAGFLDGREIDEWSPASRTPPLIDIQALNVIPHAKYLAPVADYATVIDNTSARLYERSLGVPAERIRVTGAPHNDVWRTNVAALDRREIATRIGLAPDCRKRILLASQLQPFERMRQLADPLIRILTDDPAAELLLKLHPREGEGREQAYKELFRDRGLDERVRIVRDMTAADAIAACNLCVTFYSNMARDAAIAGKEVVIALYTGWEPPIRFDLEGLAYGAKTPEDFMQTITDKLASIERDRQRAADGGTSQYLKENAHLLYGDSLAAIRGLLEELQPLGSFQTEGNTGGKRDASKPVVVLPELETLNVVVEDGFDLVSIPRVFSEQAKVAFFINKPRADGRQLPANHRLEAGHYSNRNRAWIDQAAKRGDALSYRLADALLEFLVGTATGKELTELRDAIWLQLRPTLIEAERHDANLAKGLAGDAAGLVIVGRSDDFLRQMIEGSEASAFQERRFVRIDQDLGYSLHRPEDLTVADVGTTPEDARAKGGPTNLAEFDDWLAHTQEITGKLPTGPTMLFTTAWHLKTVAPTMLPILKALPAEISVVALNMSSAKLDELADTLKQSRPVGSTTVFDPKRLAAALPTRPLRSVKHSLPVMLGHVLSSPSLADLKPYQRRTGERALTAFWREGLWDLLGWSAYCRAVFKAVPAVSVGCPGRQWHAEVAHTRAKEAKALSVTVQNAYMTAGYTYTKPTGDVVTAIDTWSRDLFIEVYGVPAETIPVTSCPRFDYLSDLRNTSDQGAARKELGLSSDEAVVLFAAQDGLEEEAKKIIHALTQVGDIARRLTFVVKLHPRSPRDLAETFARVAEEAGQSELFRITYDWPIQGALAASDLVITIYSNVGIEAAILGKDLIIANFGSEDLPVPLDKFGIGYTATNAEELAEGVVRFLTDSEFQVPHRAAQRAYVEANPLMANGGSADVIVRRIVEGLETAEGRRN